MNKLTNETATKESSKRLHDLGVIVPETDWVWYDGATTAWPRAVDGWKKFEGQQPIPAPKLRDMLELLPGSITTEKGTEQLRIAKLYRHWEFNYQCPHYHAGYTVIDENPAEAATLLYIWLVEQGLVPAGQPVSGSQK